MGAVAGITSNDRFSNIGLNAGVIDPNNNFGELLPAALKGFVYVDSSNDGIKDPNEAAIAGVSVTLSGIDDLGSNVSLTQATLSDGSYAFLNLRPGTYTVQETQPSSYLDGKDTIGAVAGVPTNDRFSSIGLGAGVIDPNNNFGELI